MPAVEALIRAPGQHTTRGLRDTTIILLIFDAADQIPVSPYGGQRQLLIPAIFRMIYCLGLRPGEAKRLHRNDVDLTRGTVSIRESKGHKDRIVFMSPDLHEYCRNYDAAISAYHPDRTAFFPNQSGVSTARQPSIAGFTSS